jgi:uncharacterized membrane protein
MRNPLRPARALTPSEVAVRAGLLGIATGGRSTAGPVALAVSRQSGDPSARPPLSLLGRQLSRASAGVAYAGELVADKLPVTPSRLQPPSLALRVVSGATSGWALAQRHRAPVGVPALLGGLGALAGSVAGARWRAHAASAGRPDLAAALAEDAAVAGLAWSAVRR